MKDFKLNRLNVLKELKLNNEASKGNPSGEMARLQKNILMQAGLALLTIVLTVVILFAMTSAWYTNIVQTGGLVFNVETWSFEGKVEIGDVETFIAPGDEGIVSLTAQNDNNDIVEFGVTIEKGTAEKAMNNEMKKRLYFYVDDQQKRNDETTERVYLNSTEIYTYTIFSKGTLRLEEEVYNAPRIKWHWVYDLLGYYVLGTQTTAEDGTASMTVKEYLRPIEYDYDSATFELIDETELAEDGTETVTKTFELVTVEGKTVAEFIEEITGKDGYPGVVDGNETGVYYPVSVDDETGEGVYLYLCTYSEIEMATDWDTDAGELAYKVSHEAHTPSDVEKTMIYHTAEIKISAQKSEIVATEVADATTLLTEIEEAESGTPTVLKLTGNVALEETLVIPQGAEVMIDLNGNTITSENATSIEAAKGSSLTVTNGIINGPEEATGNTYGIKTVGAEVVMNDVEMNNYVYSVYVGDNAAGNINDSSVYINDCKINSSFVSVFVSGNGAASEQKALIVIEDSTLTSSEGYAISGNGSDGRWGTDIQVINSTLTSELYAAVYHPQRNSTLTVSKGSVLTGKTGIAIKAGFVTIIDSTVIGNGELVGEEPTVPSKSGYNETNDAIYIETNYGHPIGLEIKGSSTVTSTNNKAIRVFEKDADNVTISIYGGTFTPGIDFETYKLWLAEGSLYQVNGNDVLVYVESADADETEPAE